jgi:hypothetical protein
VDSDVLNVVEFDVVDKHFLESYLLFENLKGAEFGCRIKVLT